jgi:hypothetical protein
MLIAWRDLANVEQIGSVTASALYNEALCNITTSTIDVFKDFLKNHFFRTFVVDARVVDPHPLVVVAHRRPGVTA